MILKITFNNAKAWQEFYTKLKNDKMQLELNGENFHVLTITATIHYPYRVEVQLELLHNPKRVAPEWTFGEDYLKDLRQQNSSLLKFTEKAIELFVSSGDAERYLKKYNNDGTEK